MVSMLKRKLWGWNLGVFLCHSIGSPGEDTPLLYNALWHYLHGWPVGGTFSAGDQVLEGTNRGSLGTYNAAESSVPATHLVSPEFQRCSVLAYHKLSVSAPSSDHQSSDRTKQVIFYLHRFIYQTTMTKCTSLGIQCPSFVVVRYVKEP